MDYVLMVASWSKEILITLIMAAILYYMVFIGNKYIPEEKRIKFTRRQVISAVGMAIVAILTVKLYNSSGIIDDILFMLLVSMIFSYVLDGPVSFFEKKGIKRYLSILIVYIIIVLSIVILSISIIPAMADEIRTLADELPKYFKDIEEFGSGLYEKYYSNLKNLPEGFNSLNDVMDQNLASFQEYMAAVVISFTNSIVGMFSKIINIVLIPIISFYLLKDKKRMKNIVKDMMPKEIKEKALMLFREINTVLNGFVRGQLIVAAFIGAATIIALLIIDVRFSIIIGIVAGLASVIPYFGPVIGIIPATFFALLDSPIKVIWVGLAFFLIQQFEGNILSPRIVGESVGLHPLIVMFSLLIGGSLAGILGMLLAVPVAGTIKVCVKFIKSEVLTS